MPRFLIAGPPCGGKTTYVARLAAPQDTVLDFDEIVGSLTGDRYAPRTPQLVGEARRIWLEALPAADWVVWTAPKRAQRGRFRSEWNAEVVVVTASLEECLRRATLERPVSWQSAIRRWFGDWEPSRSGLERVITTKALDADAVAR